MIDPKQYPLCEQFVEKLLYKFNNSGWITLCDKRIFSCLVNDNIAANSMAYDTWDINHSRVGPLINEQSDGTFISYSRYESNDSEPIVMYLENEGRWSEEAFLAEEFVMYFKLHKEGKGKNEYVYYQVDECGDDVEVARVMGVNLVVKLKYVKEYIAVKKLNLLVFIDEVINSTRSIDELGGNCIQMHTIKENDYIFSYSLIESPGFGHGYKSSAVFRGKCILRHNDKDIQHLWKLRDSGYEDFVVGADEDGKEVFMSCEENRMPNLFTRQGDDPYSLSPVFFKRDVWSRHSQAVENWKSFNVLPSPHSSYSITTLCRWFAGTPTDCSVAPDLVFKKLYAKVNDKWKTKYGWSLFKELATDDQYHFESLHLMGQDNDQKEFDGLIQSITKLLIDSLNEKQLVNAIDSTNSDVEKFLTEKKVKEHSPSNIQGGITKFECFLISEQAQNSDLVKLLRKVQELRSSTVAHRKSTKLDTKTKELFDFFGLLHDSDKVVLFNLLSRLNEMLKWLILIVE